MNLNSHWTSLLSCIRIILCLILSIIKLKLTGVILSFWIEYCKEVSLEISNYSFFFKIFLEIINLEVLFKIIPFFKRLTGLRSKGSFQYEFTLNIFKILMNGLQEKLITRILYCWEHIVLTDTVVQIHVIKLEP